MTKSTRMSDPKALDSPERIWLVDDEYGWQEARIEGNGVEYIRASDHQAEVERLNRHRDELAADKHRLLLEIRGLDEEVERLREALQAMFDEYEGVDDMAVPTVHQSDAAKRAESLARAALAAEKGER